MDTQEQADASTDSGHGGTRIFLPRSDGKVASRIVIDFFREVAFFHFTILDTVASLPNDSSPALMESTLTTIVDALRECARNFPTV